MLGLGSNISKTGKLGVHDLGVVTSNLVLKHNYDLSSVQLLSDGAASFDGVDDYINVDEGFAATNRTFTAWFNSSQNAANGTFPNVILSQTTSSGDNRWHIRIDPSDNEVKVYDGAAVKVAHASTGITIVEGQWYHVAITDNSSSVALYVNGILQNSASFTTGNDATDVFTIGQEFDVTSPSDFFKGYVCNVGVWDAILSQAQIKSIMNKNYAGLSDSEKTDLVSWWNLDSVIPDTTTFVYDNHHGGGEILGSNLTSPLDFTTWSDIGANDITANSFTTSGSGAGVSFNLTTNKLYKINVSGVTGDISIRYRDGGGGGTVLGAFDTDLYLNTSGLTSPNVYLRSLSATTATVTSVSIKEINGNTGTLS